MLLVFAGLGSLAATLFLALPSSSRFWMLSALLAICANVGFGASVVAMNAYLPSLARESEDVVQALADVHAAEFTQQDETNTESNHQPDDADEPLLPSNDSSEVTDLKIHYEILLSRATSRISSLGIALGYAAGIVLLIVALVPVTKMHGSTFSLRLAIGLSGIWWALFSIPAALWLPRANGVDERESDDKWSFRREIWEAWKRLGQMLRWREMKKLRNTFWYLGAWFLLSDGNPLLPHTIEFAHEDVCAGFTTITSTAILFGKTSLNMQPSALILIGVLTPSSGILGSLLWPVIQRRLGYSNLRILVVLVVMASMIPAYGCLGFLSVFRDGGRARFGGLTTQGEMFGLAVYFGTLHFSNSIQPT